MGWDALATKLMIGNRQFFGEFVAGPDHPVRYGSKADIKPAPLAGESTSFLSLGIRRHTAQVDKMLNGANHHVGSFFLDVVSARHFDELTSRRFVGDMAHLLTIP